VLLVRLRKKRIHKRATQRQLHGPAVSVQRPWWPSQGPAYLRHVALTIRRSRSGAREDVDSSHSPVAVGRKLSKDSRKGVSSIAC